MAPFERAVVTGGAGFIGSHLSEALLERGVEVLVLDNLSTGRRENVPAGAAFLEADIRTDMRDVFSEFGPQACFHLAAQASVPRSIADPLFDAEVNILGTLRVLEAADIATAPIVFASTCAVYGDTETVPTPEDTPFRPLVQYAASKIAAEQALAVSRALTHRPHSVVRFANVYGPRQAAHGESGVIAIFMDRLFREEPLTIFGDGSQTRDFVYVRDVVSGMLAAYASGGTFNLGSGRATSLRDLTELLAEAVGSRMAVAYTDARDGDILHSLLAIKEARRLLSWSPQYDLAKGLAATWAWKTSGGPSREAL